ncbi:tudor domain-containing protein [Trichonephila clavipes]|nr:tudor domain-containing protein [Trichonephila clavipes]
MHSSPGDTENSSCSKRKICQSPPVGGSLECHVRRRHCHSCRQNSTCSLKRQKKRNEIPPQFLQDEEIYVAIIEVKDPAHFIIKESPSGNSPRPLEFLKFEDAMQKYYRSIEQLFFPLPSRDTLVVAHFENKYYRAKVCSILNMTRGDIIKVYLVDYGKDCSVTRSCLYEIPEDFLKLPFQAVDFRFDLMPISLVMDLNEITVDYGPVTEWDVSASTFIKDIFKAMKNAFVKVKDAGQGYIIGSMYVSLLNGEIKCINEELVLKKFAQERSKCMNDEMLLHPATDISLQKEKSILDSSQPVAASTLISKPKQNEKISSEQKIRALLKKRYRAQNDINNSSTDVKETIVPSNNVPLECANNNDLQPKQNEKITSEQKIRALLKKRYRAQNDIKNSSTDVKETIVPSNNVPLECANNKGEEFGASISKQEELQKDIQPKQKKKISSEQKIRALLKKRYIAQNDIKNSSTDVKEIIVPNNNVPLESANIKGEEFGANLSKQEELQKDIQHNHSEDTEDSNKVLKSTLYKSSSVFESSSGTEVSSEANDIPKKVTAEAMKEKPLEKFKKLYRKNRLLALTKSKENSSNVETSEESDVTSELKQNRIDNPEQVIFEITDSSSESQINSHLSKVGFKKKLDVWVPHQLTPKNIMDGISICETLAKRNETDPFLKRMGTGDEKWVAYDNIVRKRSWSKRG